MTGFRVKDNRGKYWEWFRKSRSYRYGNWVTKDRASIVYSKKELSDMLRDVFRTIRYRETPFSQLVFSTGISAEIVEIEEKVLKEQPVPIKIKPNTKGANSFYLDKTPFFKDLGISMEDIKNDR